MSEQANTRYALVRWAVLRGHNLQDCISLIDTLEGRFDAIGFSNTDLEMQEAQEEYESMKKAVNSIFRHVTESALTRESDRPL